MMSEWHVTPDYIVNNWTDELLDLMIKKRNERLNKPVKLPDEYKASDDALFAQAKNLVKVVKK